VTGYKGFYYHFLDMITGARAGQCELSTVDTSFLLAGMLAAAVYFDQDSEAEQEIRTLADALYRRADWPWACDSGATVTHGWKPESGFLPYRWEGYDEAMLLYALGLGSPTYPLPTESYAAWTSSYQWKNIDGYDVLYGGPLFIHQYSHVFVDFRAIASARVIQPRSTPTGYAASAKPTAAILAGAPGCVLSATRPFAELVSFRKYAKA